MKPEPKLINICLDHLEKLGEEKGIITKEGKIPNRIKGYLASFGGTVVQLEIMPACMAFLVDKNKKALMALMWGIYRERYAITTDFNLDDYLQKHWESWSKRNRNAFRAGMTKVAVSLKLAMRTYEFDESESID